MVHGEEAFMAEATILSLLCHKHVVGLVGLCAMEEERLLVFEYMENGSLHDHLHNRQPSSPVAASWNWKTSIEIQVGVSRAIEYLHCLAQPPVVQRDIKSTNNLLDADWAPRLAGFGQSLAWDEECSSNIDVYGTLGYVDPEYYRTGNPKPTSDVYGFGVVMLEVLTTSFVARLTASAAVTSRVQIPMVKYAR